MQPCCRPHDKFHRPEIRLRQVGHVPGYADSWVKNKSIYSFLHIVIKLHAYFFFLEYIVKKQNGIASILLWDTVAPGAVPFE